MSTRQCNYSNEMSYCQTKFHKIQPNVRYTSLHQAKAQVIFIKEVHRIVNII